MNVSSSPLNVCTIEAGTPFLRVLAQALADGSLFGTPLDRNDPLALARCTILLPTRRACRAMRDMLIEQCAGRPLLLPRIRALGDADEAELALDPEAMPDFPDPRLGPLGIAPAIGALERQLLLTRLIQAWGEASAAEVLRLGAGEAPVIPGSPGHAAHLAADLGRLMDAMETENVDLEAIAALVPDDHAGYWQITLSFLDIIRTRWPDILAARGLQSVTARRNELIDAEAARLKRLSPIAPIIAAGSTGSIPATARLLKVIAGLPNGAVVLPGFDTTLDSGAFNLIAEGEGTSSHPQHGMARLVRIFGLRPGDVRTLRAQATCAQSLARRELVTLAMKPATLTGAWGTAQRQDLTALWRGLTYVEAQSSQEEAVIIAMMMRAALEQPERKVALITPDRQLARRVQAELSRWDIHLDDSAGIPLAQTMPGLFMRLVAALLLDGLSPVALLSLLKHPLCRLALPAQDVRRRARLLERIALRGPRPAPSIAGLRAALGATRNTAGQKLDAGDLLDRLEAAIGDIADRADARQMDFAALLDRHIAVATALSRDETGTSLLFAAEAGQALQQFTDQLREGAPAAWAIEAKDYPGLFAALLSGRPVRQASRGHPRLQILGLLEARLVDADCLILGSLNEGTWPQESPRDPWLNRAMRAAIGLGAPERRIGLAAHDFVQAFAAPEVVLTRSVRQNGAQTVPSRFLLRLDATLKALGETDGLAGNARRWIALAHRLTTSRSWTPAGPPAPCPPLASRPTRIAVTQVERWVRDPYAFYARHILNLRPLDPLDAAPDAADRGTLLHGIFAAFMATAPIFDQPEQAFARLRAIGAEHFAAMPDAPEIKAFWWRRFLRAASWFVAFEQARGMERAATWCEIEGGLKIDETLFLQARADRIDLIADGRLALFDYKTGATPTSKEILAGFAPQLPLEAAIAFAGGFAANGVPVGGNVAGLGFLRLTGATPPGEHIPVTAALPQELAANALAGLRKLAEAFARPDQPYHSRTRPRFEGAFDGDYDHLARAREWARRLGDDP